MSILFYFFLDGIEKRNELRKKRMSVNNHMIQVESYD